MNDLKTFTMIFALSILFVLVALYFLVYAGVSSDINRITFEDDITEKTSHISTQTSTFLDFDFETLVMPDELSIIIIKDKKA